MHLLIIFFTLNGTQTLQIQMEPQIYKKIITLFLLDVVGSMLIDVTR